MDQVELTAEQEAQAARIADVIVGAMRADALAMARFMASRQDSELLGESEFHIRDRCHAHEGRVIDAALSERKKRGYRGSSQVCPHCKKDAKFEGYRTLNHLRTLLARALRLESNVAICHWWGVTGRVAGPRLRPQALPGVICRRKKRVAGSGPTGSPGQVLPGQYFRKDFHELSRCG